MSSTLKIVARVPETVSELSIMLTEINRKTVSASWDGSVLKVDFYNWQGHLFVRRNSKGHLIYNIGREVVTYKAAPMTFSNLAGAIRVLCDIHPYPKGVDRECVMLDLAKVIHEFSLRNVN